jgi:hypothetical protein
VWPDDVCLPCHLNSRKLATAAVAAVLFAYFLLLHAALALSPHRQLAKLVTRDSMIGVAPALTPAQLQETEQRRQQAAA